VDIDLKRKTLMAPSVNRITLVTFTYPNEGADVILKDWIDFVGDSLSSVMVVSPACFEDSPVFKRWKTLSPMLEFLFIGEVDQHPDQYYALGVLTAMAQVPTEYCLFVKLDVLPFRHGNDRWVVEGIEKIIAMEAFALTGSERWPGTDVIDPQYGKTHRISLNFALYQPKRYLEIIQASNPRFVTLAHECKVRFEDRFSLESGIEEWLEATGGFNLVRQEDDDWSVFHIHQFDDALRRIRELYRDRICIDAFLNRIDPDRKEPWEYHPWERYYGMPRPWLLKRIRILCGELRRRIFSSQ